MSEIGYVQGLHTVVVQIGRATLFLPILATVDNRFWIIGSSSNALSPQYRVVQTFLTLIQRLVRIRTRLIIDLAAVLQNFLAIPSLETF